MQIIKAMERGIAALAFNLETLCNIAAYEVLDALPEKLRITTNEWERVKQGDRLLSTEEFYLLLDVFVPVQYRYKGKTCMDWLLNPPNFGLVGILRPEYYLESASGEISDRFQCFFECPCALIDNPDVEVYESDILVHDTGNRQQRFMVRNVYASPDVSPHEPAYKLQVERWRPKVAKRNQSNVTLNVGGNINIGNNAMFSGLGDVTNNSMNQSTVNPSEIFAEARRLVETLQADNKHDILEAIEIMVRAKASGNKSEGKTGLEKFLDLLGIGAEVWQKFTSTFKQWFL